jgi:hypothetical protein
VLVVDFGELEMLHQRVAEHNRKSFDTSCHFHRFAGCAVLSVCNGLCFVHSNGVRDQVQVVWEGQMPDPYSTCSGVD